MKYENLALYRRLLIVPCLFLLLGGLVRPVLAAGGYSLNLVSSSTNPADATTYYFGAHNIVFTTTSSLRTIVVPSTGVIECIGVEFANNAGTQGTSETFTGSIRINDTTDYNIGTTLTMDAANGDTSRFQACDLDIEIEAGDRLNFKLVSPTWVTNPTNVTAHATIYVEQDAVSIGENISDSYDHLFAILLPLVLIIGFFLIAFIL